MKHKVLTIAGFDGSGGAGIQADLKTFAALKCYGMSVLTSLPVQNTMGVRSIYDISIACVEEQITAIFEDIPIDAIKIGMLHREEIVEAVADRLLRCVDTPLVLDPVMVAESGDRLLLPGAIAAMTELLFPMTTVLTPNLLEASALLGREITTKSQMEQAAIDLVHRGPKAVVVKGGHLTEGCDDCLCLKEPNCEIHWFCQPKIHTQNTHGTGCTFSAAIAAYLAKGLPIIEAVERAKQYLTRAIEASIPFTMGHGHGSVHHLWNL